MGTEPPKFADPRVALKKLEMAVVPLLMVDGIRIPGQGNGTCEIDPSIIPALSQDRIDVLLDAVSDGRVTDLGPKVLIAGPLHHDLPRDVRERLPRVHE